MLQTLWRDRLVPLALLATLALALPYGWPLLPPLAFEYYAFSGPTTVLIVAAIVAMRAGLGAVASSAERRFWDLWSIAFAFWLVQALVALLTSDKPTPSTTLVQDALLVGFYLPLLLAVRLDPDRSPELPPLDLLRGLEVAGTAIFVVGFFGYFSLVPYLFDRPLYATDVPSLVFYTVLDAVVVARLASSLAAAGSPRWRTIYAWLFAGSVLWLLTDVLETLMFVEILPWRPPGHVSDLVWWLPFPPLLVAARLRAHPFAGPPAGDGRRRRAEASWGAPLVAYAAAFPVVHFLLKAFGAIEPITRSARETFTVGLLAALAGLALVYQRVMTGENRRLLALHERAMEARPESRDDPTGEPGQYSLCQRLERALARSRADGTRVAVLALALDQIQAVKRSLGDDAAEELLAEAAKRLGRELRNRDALVRERGDELVVLLEGVHDVEETARIARRLGEALRGPIHIGQQDVVVTASIGISTFPDDALDAESLLKEAVAVRCPQPE